MKRLIIFLFAPFILACGSDDPTIMCVGIWEVELLHDGATAEVVDGVLQLRVQNPKTDHDIRLIQRQTDYHTPGHLGIYVYFKNFDSETTGANNFDMQLTSWYAYNYSPNDILAALSIGTFGVRAVTNNITYNGFQTPEFLRFGGSNQSIGFTGISGTFTIPAIQPDPKTLYLDFGVKQTTGTGKSSYIAVDITEVSFSKSGEMDELVNDTFDCNSLK